MERKLVWSFSEHSGSVRMFEAYLSDPLQETSTPETLPRVHTHKQATQHWC